MNLTRRRGIQAFFITLGVCLIGVAITLNVTWIQHNKQRLAIDLLGVLLFSILIAGVVLNTIFLVREIRRNTRQDAFLNTVTHELKTPIASLRLYLDTLERRPVSDEQRRAFYQTMRADTDRLLSTVEQVLKAGEIGHRHRAGKRTRVELYALLAECVEVVRRRYALPLEAITLAEVPGSVRLFTLGDEESLKTAMLNLLDNAVKYSPNGVQVECRLRIEKYIFAVLSISDTGLGLPHYELKRIFRRFYRASAADRVRIKGTGLGLFLVRTISKQHGGSVEAVSAGLGKGTTMLLRLPLALS